MHRLPSVPPPLRPRRRVLGTFSQKVGLLVVSVLVVTGLLNWAIAGYTMDRLTRAEVARSTGGLAQGTAERIAQLLAFGKSELISHSREEPALAGGDPAALQEAVARIRRDLQLEFPFDGMSFIDTRGRLLAIDPPSPELIGTDLSERDYVRQVLATGEPYVSDAVQARTGRLIVVLAVPVRGPDGRLAGVLSGSLHLQRENLLSRLLQGLESDRQVRHVVVDGAQVVLYATQGTDGVGTRFPVGTPGQAQPGVASGDWVSPGGEKYLSSYVPVPETRWGVLAMLPADQAFASIWQFHRQTFLLSLSTLIFAAFISFALSQALTMPLYEILAAMRDVARGRMDVRVPAFRTLEWQQLGQAFNLMAAELAEFHRRLQERASRDPLTGVLNRGSLDEELKRQMAVARQAGTPLAVLMMDIDDFKAYNDAFGHQAGDEVLRTCARVALDNVRDVDLVGRYGGEEFAVVLRDTDSATALAVAERIRRDLATRPFLRPVTVSIGVACFPAHGGTVREVVARADEALYAAKRAGKNRVVAADHFSVDWHDAM